MVNNFRGFLSMNINFSLMGNLESAEKKLLMDRSCHGFLPIWQMDSAIRHFFGNLFKSCHGQLILPCHGLIRVISRGGISFYTL